MNVRTDLLAPIILSILFILSNLFARVLRGDTLAFFPSEVRGAQAMKSFICEADDKIGTRLRV
jgi:hypothetical protein